MKKLNKGAKLEMTNTVCSQYFNFSKSFNYVQGKKLRRYPSKYCAIVNKFTDIHVKIVNKEIISKQERENLEYQFAKDNKALYWYPTAFQKTLKTIK